MKIKLSIFNRFFTVFFLMLTFSSELYASKSFQFLSFEMANNYSKRLEKFNTTYHLGIGLGEVFEKGLIEVNPLIIIDDSEITRFDGESQSYKLTGYMVGVEYNSRILPYAILGAGIYLEQVSESFANLNSNLVNAEFKRTSYFGSIQLKVFTSFGRPYFRLQFGSSIHNYSMVFGANLIRF